MTFFIDRDGFVVRRAVGALTAEKLALGLEDLLAETTPRDNGELVNPDQYYDIIRKPLLIFSGRPCIQ